MAQRIAFIAGMLAISVMFPSSLRAQEGTASSAAQMFQDAVKLASAGRHYAAAAAFFNVYTANESLRDTSLGRLTEELMRSGLPNAASYFFIKTLQSENKAAIRRVLPFLPYMIDSVGGDLLRKYVLRHTSESDYDTNARNHFYYFLAKDDLLKGDPGKALQALTHVTFGSDIMAQASYLRGTAYAILGQPTHAVAAFGSCQNLASKVESRFKIYHKEAFDLEARCTAGLARSYYQAKNFDRAEEVYDDIPKASFVWTDILFEQAWNAYSKGDYNRALGKLVTYRSPSLNFVFNPEVDVLRAQSFLELCLYDDVNKSAIEFTNEYEGVGSQIKNFLLQNDVNLPAFYTLAKQVFRAKLHNQNMMHRALNRFIRGPYFASLLTQERSTYTEAARIRVLHARESRVNSSHQAFGSFLDKVLRWRLKSVELLGGLFVKNSLYDVYQDLLADLDKMSFIKLEMLNQTRRRLEHKGIMSEDESGTLKRGTASISRHDYQYFWTFNGEFWNDELGDYVFSLESECGS